MAGGEGDLPDWRDAAAYEPLLLADRSIFAWEWLRRDPEYRAVNDGTFMGGGNGEAPGRPDRFGLHAFLSPRLSAPRARPLWRADVFPFVLEVEARKARDDADAFDLARFAATATLLSGCRGREHLLISDGLRVIRLDVVAGSIAQGAVELRYRLRGFAAAQRPLMTLQRLMALRCTGRFSRSLHQAEARAGRWILALRTRDALAAGADQRKIAAVLLSAEVGEPGWRTHYPSLRSRVQRLVRAARSMEAGGFRRLLCGDTRSPPPG